VIAPKAYHLSGSIVFYYNTLGLMSRIEDSPSVFVLQAIYVKELHVCALNPLERGK
jgi:hypothetical protein